MSLPNKGWLIAALLLWSAATASARNAVIDSNLNLRAGPGLTHRVVMVMPSGATVTVGECSGEWCRVSFRGRQGFVSSALLKGGDGAYAAAPAPAPIATKYDPDDAVRVLQWKDREWRDRYWRELEMRRLQR